MELYQLKLFVDLANTGNFTKVANENYVTQAAVTLQIRKLESELGLPLFHRTTRSVTLLESGEKLLPYAKDVLKKVEEAMLVVRETRAEVSGLVRIASVHSVGLYELPPYIKKFLKKFPDVNLRIDYRTADEIYHLLLDGDIDVGIVAYPSEMTRVDILPLFTDQLAIVCRADHALAQKKKVKLADLANQNFVQFSEDTPTRRASDAVLADHEINVNVRMECDNIEILKQMIDVDFGISLLPRNSITAQDEKNGLRAIEIDDLQIERPVGVLLLKNAPRFKAVRAFVETLIKNEDDEEEK